jgi:alpha-N-arabinofuranosidase
VLRARIQTPGYATATHPKLDFLLASVLHDPRSGRATVFALNRAVDEEMALSVELRGLGNRKLVSASELHHHDLKAANTKSAPAAVTPKQHGEAAMQAGHLRAMLRPLSWNVFVTEPL